MKSVLLIGLGRFGCYVAQALNEQGDEVMAIDRDEERVNDALKFVTNAQIGDSTNERFIDSLGVRNFDLCIVTIADNFQSSLETVSLLKDCGAKFVLARVSDDTHAKFLLRNGADDVVYLEKQMAQWTAVTYSNDNIFDYMELSDEYAIYETPVPKSWVGKSVLDVDVRRKHNLNILATKIQEVIKPLSGPSHVFSSSENLLLLASKKDIQKYFKKVF